MEDMCTFTKSDPLFSAWPYNMLLAALGDPERASTCCPSLLGPALDVMTDQERSVLYSRYKAKATLKDIAKAYGVSVSAISRIEHKAFRKLRDPKVLRLITAVPLDEYRKLQSEHKELQTEHDSLRKAFLNLGLGADPDKLYYKDGTPADDIMFASLEALNLPDKTVQKLNDHQVATVGRLIQMKPSFLEQTCGLNETAIRTIQSRLSDLGLQLNRSY